MTARRAIIGGASRHLDAWKPTGRKFSVVKPSINLAAMRMEHVIAKVPTDYNQGELGSCGPNSLGEVFEFFLGKKFSRLFLYYWTRATEGDIADDGGVTIPDLLDVAHSMGMPPEELWPYMVDRYRDAPPMNALAAAIQHRVTQNDVISDLDHLLFELDRDQPVTFGFLVPASMEDGAGPTATTGIVNVPSASDPSIGGHCVNAIGFDRARGLVRTTCHYGSSFGDPAVPGTILLPFAHWSSGNVSDMRAVRGVS